MTSQGLDTAIDTWLGAYAKYFQGQQAACDKPCCEGEEQNCKEEE